MARGHACITFDRGTIAVEADLHDLAVPGLVWDERVGVHRARALDHARVRDTLEQAGFRLDDQVLAAGEGPGEWTPAELRPYQCAALDAWELAGRRGLVVLPTGAGKTHVALGAMAQARVRTLCLVPTRALVEQWTAQITRRYLGPVGCFSDGSHDRKPVTVATFESAYRHMDRLGNQFELLVVDEAHHFGRRLRDEALEMCAAPARLGLTATPPASASAERLEELLGPRVFDLAIGDLAGTYLATFDLVTLHLELTVAERLLYERARSRFAPMFREHRRHSPGATWADFVTAAARSGAGQRALDAWREMQRLVRYPAAKRHAVGALLARHRDSRVLVFTADNETAYTIARTHLVMPLTCDIGRQERTAALARFKEGDLRALVSARVLNEGIDVPDADVAIVVGGTQGGREHVQRVGRLLRPRPGKRAIVYELVCRATAEVAQAQKRRRALALERAAQL